jgi:hypothetical protein
VRINIGDSTKDRQSEEDTAAGYDEAQEVQRYENNERVYVVIAC